MTDRLSAIHEAGHATVGYVLGQYPERVSIRAQGDSQGHVRYLGVEVVEDDLLRPAIRREDARKIVQERREQELRDAPHPAEVSAPLVAVGVPAIDGGTPVEALTSRDPAYKTPAEEFGGRPKPNFLEEELAAGARQLAAAKAEAERKMRRVLEGRDK